jgi:hypothetical protein
MDEGSEIAIKGRRSWNRYTNSMIKGNPYASTRLDSRDCRHFS